MTEARTGRRRRTVPRAGIAAEKPLNDDTVDFSRDCKIQFSEPALAVSAKPECDLPPTDVNVRVVIGLLRNPRQLADKIDPGHVARKAQGAHDLPAYAQPSGDGCQFVNDIGFGKQDGHDECCHAGDSERNLFVLQAMRRRL